MLLIVAGTLALQKIPDSVKMVSMIESTIDYIDNTDQATRDKDYRSGSLAGQEDGYYASINSDGQNLTTEFKYDIDGESRYYKKGYISGYKDGYAKAVLDRSKSEDVLYVGIRNNDNNIQYAPIDFLTIIYSNTVNQNSLSQYSIVKDYKNETVIEKNRYVDLKTNDEIKYVTYVSSSIKVKDYIYEKLNECGYASTNTNEYVRTFDSILFANELELQQSFVR